MVEIGAGPKRGTKGWLTLDSCEGSDIQWSLENGLPFNDSSVQAIYASHVLEHFYYSELLFLLSECWRVLDLGGVLSVAVPNARLYIDAYYNKTDFPPKEKVYTPAISNTGSEIDKLNYIAYMDGHHKYMFDTECLIRILERCNFKSCALREYDPNLDLSGRDFESIYAKAYK
jgi:predicted SAM-dependent methyltransferase